MGCTVGERRGDDVSVRWRKGEREKERERDKRTDRGQRTEDRGKREEGRGQRARLVVRARAGGVRALCVVRASLGHRDEECTADAGGASVGEEAVVLGEEGAVGRRMARLAAVPALAPLARERTCAHYKFQAFFRTKTSLLEY